MGLWRHPNRLLYRLYFGGRHLPILLRSRHQVRRFFQAWPGPETKKPEGQVLFLSWGRIGDTLLAAPLIRGLPQAFPGCRIVQVGRAEVEPLVRGVVDHFLPFDPGRWRRSPAYRQEFLARVAGSYRVILGDLHLFQGGIFYFQDLMELLGAERKFFHPGYYGGPGLAPWRRLPRGVQVVPARPKGDPSGPPNQARHVWHDAVDYLRQILRALGREGEFAGILAATRAPLELGAEGEEARRLLADLRLEPGRFVACQLVSNNPKKDYPLDRWRQVLQELGGETVVVLGSAREAGRARRLDLPNLVDLCGATSLEECATLLRQARLFVGLDSGLTHLAAHLGQRTVAIAQSANLGFFLPYPDELGLPRVRVVHHPDYAACAGCFMACSRESLLATYRRGARCLREIPPARVVAAIRVLLGS